MKPVIRNFSVFFIFAFIAVVLAIIYSNMKKTNGSSIGSTPFDMAFNENIKDAITIEGVTYKGFGNGDQLWKAEAKRASVNEKNMVSSLKDVKASFFGKDSIYDLTARKGLYYMSDKKLVLKGKVVLKSLPDYIVKADKISYVQDKEEITATGNVSLKYKSLNVTSGELKLNVKKSEVFLREGVEAVIVDSNI